MERHGYAPLQSSWFTDKLAYPLSSRQEGYAGGCYQVDQEVGEGDTVAPVPKADRHLSILKGGGETILVEKGGWIKMDKRSSGGSVLIKLSMRPEEFDLGVGDFAP